MPVTPERQEMTIVSSCIRSGKLNTVLLSPSAVQQSRAVNTRGDVGGRASKLSQVWQEG